MHRMSRRFIVLLMAACWLLCGAGTARAQLSDGSTPAASGTENQAGVAKSRTSRGIVVPLYAGLIATQVLDVHSTRRAIGEGRREANAMVRWATSRPAAFIGFKVATTTGTVLLVERVRRTHPKRALFLLAAIDSAYAFVVAHNYRGAAARR
jgi:uncharacterized protein DUF5658